MTDHYLDLIRLHWVTIYRAYSDFADKHPIILLHLKDTKVYAYPYSDFKTTLSPRSQKSLAREYWLAQQSNDIVVFVRDDKNQQLISTSLPAEPKMA